jgi:RHS repeat-associated protein
VHDKVVAYRRGAGRAFPVVLVLVSAAFAGISSASADDTGFAAFFGSSATPYDPARLAAVMADGDRRAQDWQSALAKKASAADQAASESAYADQSNAAALDTAQASFGAAITAPLYTAPPLPSDEHIAHYLDEHTAQIASADGPGAVVFSTLPFKGLTPSGTKAPLDLGLQAAPGGYTPLASLTRVILPDNADNAIRLPDGSFSVRLDGATTRPAEDTHDRLFFANAFGQDADTDAVLQAAPTGFEISYILRSANAPETQRVTFDLPAGGKLVLHGGTDQAQSVTVQDADGHELGFVAPPTATDAVGASVPVTYSLDGTDALVIHVAHQQANPVYPVLVDPQVGAWGTNMAASWTWGTNASGTISPYSEGTYAYSVGPPTAGQGVNGQWGEWTFNSVPNAFIYELYNYNVYHYQNNSQEFAGLYNQHTSWYESGSWRDTILSGGSGPGGSGSGAVRFQSADERSIATDYCAAGTTSGSLGGCPRPSPGVMQTGNTAVSAGLMLTAPEAYPGNRPEAVTQGAYLYQADDILPSTPTVSISPNNPGWLGRGAVTLSSSSSDTGLGLSVLGVSGPFLSGYQPVGVTGSCSYSAGTQPCPTTLSGNFTINGLGLPQGMNTLGVGATDISGNNQNQPVYMGVDITQPTLSLSGSLADANNGVIGEGTYGLSAAWTDGSSSAPQSGVKTLQIAVDGQVVSSSTPCSTPPAGPSLPNCYSGSTSWNMAAGDYGTGSHTVTVTAGDWAVPQNTQTASITFDVHASAQAHVGPGSVNLNNGELTLHSTDVSVTTATGSLGVQRAFLSRHLNSGGPLGPSWSISTPGSAAADFQSLTPSPSGSSSPTSVTLTDAEGRLSTFTSLGGGTYSSPPRFQGWTLSGPATRSGSGLPTQCTTTPTYQLTDPSGDLITFAAPAGSSAFAPCADSQPGQVNQNTYQYAAVGGVLQPQYEIAPIPAGVTCTPPNFNAGCRALSFTYASSTATRSDCPSGQGDFTGRLTTVSYIGYDPTSNSVAPIAVARYCYPTIRQSGVPAGVLGTEFDPRVTPALYTKYSYNGSNRVATLTPPGQQAWTINYGTVAGDSNPGRVLSMSRPDPALTGTPTWTLTYGLPLAGTGAPYPMDSTSVGQWGQSDLPTTATAIMSPDSTTPTDYTKADVYYLDSRGRLVNVAHRGGRITTTEYDANDNVKRTLTAANRVSALNSGTPTQTAAKLDSEFTYNGDGSELTDELGPEHAIQLADGTQVSAARRHVQYTYDESAYGVPTTGGPYRLATTISTGAAISGQSDADVRALHRDFSGPNGVTLHKPTSVITDPGGGAPLITESTLYDPNTGMVTEHRLPEGPGGGDAHSTHTYYYVGDGSSSISTCNNPNYAGLPCQVSRPQPNTPLLPDLATRTYAYSVWNVPASITETTASHVRTTQNTYDSAGRVKTRTVTADVGNGVPVVTYNYDNTTGLLSSVTNTIKTVSMQYDTLGRVVQYGDGNGGAQASYTYDSDGRLSTVGDGKGTQTSTYDPTTGDLTSLQDTVGTNTLTWGASYDADGGLKQQDWPNGMSEAITYDASGDASDLTYTKTSNCSSNCTWYSQDVKSSIHDQWLSADSTQSSQQYAYDKAGRLLQVNDTPKAAKSAANRDEFAVPTASAGPAGIATGPDNAEWFTENNANKIGRVSTSGSVSEFTVPTAASKPQGIAAGPDGLLWFAETATNKLAKVTTSGTFTQYTAPTNSSGPYGITVGSDGALWFTENSASRIGRITTAGTATDYRIPTTKSNPTGIAAGPDNALWFAENGTNKIGRVTTAGVFTEYTIPTASSGPQAITAGPDGALWFTEASANKIGRITTSGSFTEYAIPTTGAKPTGIAQGADGALWFTESVGGKVGRITTSGAITEYAMPSGTPGLAQAAIGPDNGLWVTEATSNKVGRLKDGTLCTVRVYGYDRDTNRTDLTTIPHPAFSGACDTAPADGVHQAYSYDAADRLYESSGNVAYNGFGDITSLPAADAGGQTLSASYYADNSTYSVSQNGLNVQYNLDPVGRTRETVTTGTSSSDVVSHFADDSDSAAWTSDAGGAWTRYAGGMDGALAAIETAGGTSLELTDLGGNVIAEASTSPTASGLTSTNESTEYGAPRGSSPPKFGWLGAQERSTDLPSGVVAMGARTYVAADGRFQQPDPVPGGSPNDYAYTTGDPINESDPSGTVTIGLGDSVGTLSDGTIWTPELQAQWQANWDAQNAAAAAAAAQAAAVAGAGVSTDPGDGSTAAYMASMGCGHTGCVPPPGWHPPKKKKKKKKKKKNQVDNGCEVGPEAYRVASAAGCVEVPGIDLTNPPNLWTPSPGWDPVPVPVG